jgi:hypothetical protein
MLVVMWVMGILSGPQSEPQTGSVHVAPRGRKTSGKVLGERLETPRRQSGDLEIQGIVVVKMPSDVEVMALGVGVKVMIDVVIVFEVCAVNIWISVVQAE